MEAKTIALDPFDSLPDLEALEEFPQVPYDGEPDGLEEAIEEVEEEEGAPTTEREPNSPSGESDHVKQYLKEIGSYPLLSLEEEIELARLILEGQEAAEALARALGIEAKEVSQLALARILERVEDLPSGLLLLEERIKGDPRLKRLYQRVREGERARRDMVNANLRLVVSVAKRFTRKADKLHLLDLIQEGNRGLIRATYTFDYRKGYKFSTYATWWIRQAINRAIADQGRTVRLPVHFHESWQKLKAAQLTLEKELGRTPQAEELAAFMGEDWDAKRVEEVFSLTQNVYSLDEPVGDEKDSLYGDFLTDENLPHPEDRAMQNVMLEGAVGGPPSGFIPPKPVPIICCMQEVLERLEFWKDRLAESLEDLTFSTSEKIQDLVWTLEDRLERLGESWERMSPLIQHANAELARIAEHRGTLAVAWGLASPARNSRP